MKTLLLFLLSCGSLFAQLNISNPFYVAPILKASGVTCSTANDSELVNHLSGSSVSGISTTAWAAQQFTISAGATITGVFIRLADTGSDVGNMVVSLYQNNGGDDKPSTEIANTTVTIAMTSISASEANVFFELPQTFSAGAGTKYHIVFRCSASGTSNVYYDAGVLYADGKICNSTDTGATWSTPGTSADYHFSIWGCP
jgi:hypothetical protein